MIEIKNNVDCCGCTACSSICPKVCISMERDREGFLYPLVDKEKCIECNLCIKVCPIINNKKENKFEQKGLLINNKDEKIRKESTAGGAFSAIGNYIIEKGGVVFGAAFDENLKVIHRYVENNEELFRFRNSKYVQSDLKKTFKEVEKFLKNGKLVCYSGTPCQIEGLKSFLMKEYDNLITVDVVCHAVPSPLVWEKYLEYIKMKLNAKEIKNGVFRDKNKYGYKYSMMTIDSDNGTYSQGVDTDPYLRAFFNDLSDRPSCYDCKFKKRYRVSDFTIWDCFNVEDFEKGLDDDKGTTRVLIHSEKGRKIFEEIKENFKYEEINPDDLVKGVKEMYYSVNKNKLREEFFYDINEMNEVEFFTKYFPINMKVKIEGRTRKIMVKLGVYKSAKKIAKRLLKK